MVRAVQEHHVGAGVSVIAMRVRVRLREYLGCARAWITPAYRDVVEPARHVVEDRTKVSQHGFDLAAPYDDIATGISGAGTVAVLEPCDVLAVSSVAFDEAVALEGPALQNVRVIARVEELDGDFAARLQNAGCVAVAGTNFAFVGTSNQNYNLRVETVSDTAIRITKYDGTSLIVAGAVLTITGDYEAAAA